MAAFIAPQIRLGFQANYEIKTKIRNLYNIILLKVYNTINLYSHKNKQKYKCVVVSDLGIMAGLQRLGRLS